jgi:hypothetical protein
MAPHFCGWARQYEVVLGLVQREVEWGKGSGATRISVGVILALISMLFVGGYLDASSSSATTPNVSKSTRPAVRDPSLPSQCHIVPGQPAAMEIPGTGALNRQHGGVVRVIATAKRGYNLATLNLELGFFVTYDGNCLYSEHLTQSGRRPPQLFVGFSSSSQMNPSAVAQFLRKQTFAFSSVRLTK